MNVNFILSSGRTGTVFLAGVLNALPGVSACHERYSYFLRLWQNMRLSGKDTGAIDPAVWWLFDFLKEKKKIHFEINPNFKAHTSELLREYPDANYWHIVRDPRTYVRSAVNWGEGRRLNRWLKMKMPYWVPRPREFRLGGDERNRLFELSVHNWKVTNENYSGLRNKTDKYKLLKYEDLVRDSESFTSNLLKGAGYQQPEMENLLKQAISKAPKNVSEKTFPEYGEWGDEYQVFLKEEVGELMDRFGY